MFKKIISHLIYILIVLIPLTHKEMFSIYDPDLVYSKIVLLSIAFIGLIFVLKDLKDFSKDKLFLLLLSIVLFQMLSLIKSSDVLNTFKLIIFQFSITFSYPVFKKYFEWNKGKINDLVIVYGLTFVGVFIFLLYQIYLQNNFGVAIGGVWPVPQFASRFGATFWDINHFGAYLSAAFFLLFGGLIMQKKSSRKILFLPILIAILYSLNLTGSRSSIIGFLFGALSFALIYNARLKSTTLDHEIQGHTIKSCEVSITAYPDRKVGVADLSSSTSNKLKLGNTTWLFAGLSTAIIPISLMYLFAQKIHDAFLYRSVSFFSHLFLIKVGTIVSFQNMLLGIGANSFHAYFKNSEWANAYYYIDEAALSYKLPLHNLWLEVASETGLISLIFFIIFWVFLLKLLYDLFKTKNDFYALGLLSGIVSFLIGGFMYSYKSEFFWIYVVIACAYVVANTKSIKLPKINYLSSLLFIFSIVALIIPAFYIISPLNSSEIQMFYGVTNQNVFIQIYQYLLNLFRYIFGNYSFTGRSLSFLFYVSTVFVLLGILRKTCSFLHSLVSTAIVVHLASIIIPIMAVSTKWYLSLIMVSIIFIINFIVSLKGSFVCHRTWNNKIFYLLGLILAVSLSTMTMYQEQKIAYDEDLTFLTELAENRGLFDESDIWIDKSINAGFVHYYCDGVNLVKKDFAIDSCKINLIAGDYIIEAQSPKVVILQNIKNSNANILLNNESAYNKREIVSGDYKLTIREIIK